MNEYWKKRNSELLKIHAQKADDIERELIKEYERSLNGIKKEIETFYARYAGENGISMAEARKQLSREELKGFKLSLEEFREKALDNADGKWTTMLDNEYMRSRVSRLEALKYQMRGEVELLKQKQEDKFSTSLKKAYSDTYYTTNKHIADSVDYAVNFAKFDRDTVKNAIYEKWLDGSNFSDRIWNDKQKLLRELNTNLVHGITRGDSPDKMIKNISARMNVSKSRSAALYQTEYTHIMVDARLRSIMDAGCDEYEIDENMDSDICDECASMHGKHFKLSEYQQGITAPPFHTRCRGTITGYFVEEEGIEHTMPEEDVLQNYKPYEVDTSDTAETVRGGQKLNLSRVTNSKYDMYATDSVKLKPKELHNLNKCITSAYELLKQSKSETKPTMFLISEQEMQKSAVASYNSISNILYINAELLHSADIETLQKDLAMGDNPVSTYLHELIHWQDADDYRKKGNSINTPEEYKKYIAYLREYCKKKLDREKAKGYNIFVSKYAEDEFGRANYDETYTEYRVQKLLERGKIR